MSVAAVAVFCGSRFGTRPDFLEAAREMGWRLGQAGMRLVYGGGDVGLMGAVADATLAAGGAVSGVIPTFLETREVMHEGVTDLTVTDSMHSRKQLMFTRADAFVVLPGGLGTFDETIEIVTWRQLRLHDKPIFIVNVAGWADPMLAMLRAAVENGFAEASALDLFEVVPDVATTMERLGTVVSSPVSEDASRL
ncbi:TIGR00730 family Rossman fold protein [Gluconacetobacter sacchari]|uniref:Cytokinin riboside 5'-monophosphate phosphoribohydrolase n=2 Tax=Gluconacetobacter sacchari TaxID=92759 RepID=A0A7W4IB07_9PROT|nr:TIGR00730 family Rossman fold protein [Gluconacetobacter sacchari]MBB2159543.1 TIGR00730 family Rossman fold protein [Gluconacetobacter sacchari]GBQ20891.1 lysine decarboxylase [Gluconacetobacter sacchari DSM 12717]